VKHGADIRQFALATPSTSKPLTGVRVIDAGNMVAAPFASVLLADLGAEVIKLEHPVHGDGQRKLEPVVDGVPLWWKTIARNKRCITLDLGKPAGAEVFKDLVRNRDVVIENYRPGTLERWGIGYDVIKSIEPKAVLLRISGFGQTGPYKDRPGFGRVAEAMSGLTHLIGEADGPPMSPGYPLGDLIAGLFGAFSVMVALYKRDALAGSGQVIDLALYEAVFRLLDFDAIHYQQSGAVHTRSGNQVAYVAPSSTYRTSDGKYVTMAASNHNIWVRLCRAIGREDLVTDPRYVDNLARVSRSDEINGIVADWVGQRTRDEVVEQFERHEVAFSVIYDIQDIFSDPHYAARQALIRVLDPDLREAVVQNVVPRFSETPGSVDHLGHPMGAHNDEVYRGELGYSDERIAALQEAKVI
jgi:crotonobetainyl-CoA:carnitine CoA-transferase CaiB-like acyl-CoA transferase